MKVSGDSYTGINLEGLEKALNMDLNLEETSSNSRFYSENYKYKLTTEKYDWLLFPWDTKVGRLAIHTKPSGDNYYSGRRYQGKLSFNLSEELEKKFDSNKCKIVYVLEIEEMGERNLKRKDYLKKFGLWKEDKEGLVQEIFPTNKLFK